MAEDFKLRQHWIERGEARARREEELFELRQKEITGRTKGTGWKNKGTGCSNLL
jgi:hypothetical protein